MAPKYTGQEKPSRSGFGAEPAQGLLRRPFLRRLYMCGGGKGRRSDVATITQAGPREWSAGKRQTRMPCGVQIPARTKIMQPSGAGAGSCTSWNPGLGYRNRKGECVRQKLNVPPCPLPRFNIIRRLLIHDILTARGFRAAMDKSIA